MSYTIVLGIIIGIAFLGLIISAKKQSRNSIAKPLVLVFTLIILSCGGLLMIDNLVPPNIDTLVNNRLIFSKSAGFRLAQYMTKTVPDGKFIVLTDSNPAEKEKKAQQAVVDGLNEACAQEHADITVVAVIPHKPSQAEQALLAAPGKFTAADFNKTLKRFPKCNILISLIGLPADLGNMKIAQTFLKTPKKAPKIALLNCRVKGMYKLMQGGFITAIVLPNPKKKYSEDSPVNDLRETFDMRYLLITKENMDKIAKEFPRQIFRELPDTSKK